MEGGWATQYGMHMSSPGCYSTSSLTCSLSVAKKGIAPTPPKKARKPTSAEGTDHATWPDVWKTGFDNLYNLAQSGNIYGLVALFLAVTLAILAYRLPAESLLSLVGFFVDEHNYLLFLLSGLLVLSLFANWLQWRTYIPQIKELADQRKQTMKGLASGELSPLSDVSTSNFDLESGQTSSPLTQEPSK
jgi:hypothetical protein